MSDGEPMGRGCRRARRERRLAWTRIVALLAIAAGGAGVAIRGSEADSPETSSSRVTFTGDVLPALSRLSCNAAACHGASSGKGGLRLSLFGAYPDEDYAALTREAGGRRVDTVEPGRSLLLLKVTGGLPHEGGAAIEPGSRESEVLAAWVAQGLRLADENAPVLTSIEVSPRKAIVEKGGGAALVVRALFADGSARDVTADSLYSVSPEATAGVDGGGRLAARDYGQATVVVEYQRHFATVEVIVPRPSPEPFPRVAGNNRIDDLVLAKLEELGVPPSDLCSDAEFIRRAYLDVIGTLPTAAEARSFLEATDARKRTRVIDRLLESEEFADYWALKWGDLLRIKSEFPSNLWPNAVQAYHRWIRDSIASGQPYDQFARELLTATGSNFRVPAVNYYRAFLKREPQNLSEATALIFMGARIGCARCHAHPEERWTLDDSLGLAAFFSQIRYKSTTEWKEEIIYLDRQQRLRHPATSEVVAPRLPSGEVPAVGPEADAREVLASWLTAPENPWFARNIVNRIWFWLLGRGIVHEPDDLRSTNPPTNPELLAYLEDELVSHGFDLKHVYRLILSSRTYQLSFRANDGNRDDTRHFSHYYVKRLGAETLLDAIGCLTDRWDVYRSIIPEPFVVMPEGFRATHLADGSIGVPFLELFGRPPRDTAFESDRDMELSMRQTLHLLNSGDVQSKIAGSPRLNELLREKRSDAEIAEELYLAAYSRPPSEGELQRVIEYVSRDPKLRAQTFQDLLWALINTKEFLFNH